MTTKLRTLASLDEYLLLHLEEEGLATKAVNEFGISRQAVNKHLRELVSSGQIEATGKTRERRYRHLQKNVFRKTYMIASGLEEDVVWSRDVSPALGVLPKSAHLLWNFAFTEIFNNAIDHSEGTEITVSVTQDAYQTSISILDDGVGIFAKIQRALGLPDERQSVLELAKGKLTTDADRHSGWGIFFSSRMMDRFSILAGNVYFGHESGQRHDWLLENKKGERGTVVSLELSNRSTRQKSAVFERFSKQGTYGFDKTVVPLSLAQYGNDQLVSRSQAKRVLSRVELFSNVMLDFREVEMIGQPFADEIFRVFVRAHPDVKITTGGENAEVRKVIRAAEDEARKQVKQERRVEPVGERQSLRRRR